MYTIKPVCLLHSIQNKLSTMAYNKCWISWHHVCQVLLWEVSAGYGLIQNCITCQPALHAGKLPDVKLKSLNWGLTLRLMTDFLVSCLQSTIFEDSILQIFGKKYSIELSVMLLAYIDATLIHSTFSNHSHDQYLLCRHCSYYYTHYYIHHFYIHHCGSDLQEKTLCSSNQNSSRSRSRSGPIATKLIGSVVVYGDIIVLISY